MFWNQSFILTASLFERLLAITNILCFVSSFIQYRGLYSSKGILPVKETINKIFLRDIHWWEVPTICRWYHSDKVLELLHYIGIINSLLAFFGICPGLTLLLSGLCYQSLKNVAGPFLGLQMHANLIETNYLYSLTSPFIAASPLPLIIIQWSLLSRVMLGGAIGKFCGGDKSWKDLTAMSYHYWTQPLPNPLSPYFHRMPMIVHKIESLLTFITEGIGAIAVWSPWQFGRMIAFLCFLSILLMINISGNFGHLGLLTMVESVTLLNDDIWLKLLNQLPFNNQIVSFLYFTWNSPFCLSRILQLDKLFSFTLLNLTPYLLVVIPYQIFGLVPFISTFGHHTPLTLLSPITGDKPIEIYNSLKTLPLLKPFFTFCQFIYNFALHYHPYVHSFDLCCRYVKFGHMTKRRWEIILEGSNNKTDWIEYDFKAKPNINKSPPILFNHIPMLDWRLWFLPNEFARGIPPPKWFIMLMKKLSENEKCVLALMGKIPFEFQHKPPKYIRALLYDYRFTYKSEQDEKERKRIYLKEKQSQANLNEKEEIKTSTSKNDKEDFQLPPINKNDYWYRLQFIDQYGPTITGPIQSPAESESDDDSDDENKEL